jgi:hypothetical protein
MPLMGRSAVPGAVQLTKTAAECLDLVLVRRLLAFGVFHRFQHFLHVLEGGLEGFDDVVYLLDGIGDRCRGGRMKLAWWGWGRLVLGREGAVLALLALGGRGGLGWGAGLDVSSL